MIDTYSVDGQLLALTVRIICSDPESAAEVRAEARRLARQEAIRHSVFTRAHWHYTRLARSFGRS